MIEFEALKQNYQYILGDISAIDYLIECESILSSSGLYAYKHWQSGEIISGPVITPYWVTFKLMYTASNAPDMKGLRRLLTYGIRHEVTADTINETPMPHAEDIVDNPRTATESKEVTVVVVELSIPKRLISANIREFMDLDAFYMDAGIDDEPGIDGTEAEETEIDTSTDDDDLDALDDLGAQ